MLFPIADEKYKRDMPWGTSDCSRSKAHTSTVEPRLTSRLNLSEVFSLDVSGAWPPAIYIRSGRKEHGHSFSIYPEAEYHAPPASPLLFDLCMRL
jgi:hypothetical protein